ncbi:Magnesium transport protein CorA [Teratosphaeria destructans]|uniref:Magnesium transport protein CorA n=1 Tax=Teratosphaeria destructans TaxID=418781 RepID=A0A9W7SHX4_9PEZI|nr:Magnesium transport protein CorA [Teratosphaeria destructans]
MPGAGLCGMLHNVKSMAKFSPRLDTFRLLIPTLHPYPPTPNRHQIQPVSVASTVNHSRPLSTTTRRPQRQRRPWNTGVGAEPGLGLPNSVSTPDNAPANDQQIDTSTNVRIVDYSSDRYELHDLPTTSLHSFLATTSKPTWAACRWVYINGIDRATVHTLGRTYNLHPLALEDVMNADNPSKIDWYDDHCLLELTMQKLAAVVEEPPSPPPTPDDSSPPRHPARRFSYAASDNPKDTEIRAHLRHPGRHFYQRFDMSVEQVSLLLTHTGTVITIFETSGHDVFTPIHARLQTPHTILRSSNDPSMLVQAVLDALVDLSIPVSHAFADAFNELELAVLTHPSLVQSRQVYVLRSGLSSFLDLLTPTAGLLRAICDHREVPRQMAAASAPHAEIPAPQAFASRAISPLTQAYLRDVQDHVTTLASRTHRAIRSTENLTSLIFNTITAKQNESVRQLTLVSIFFLPLTFLTGYFGMNFDPMPVVQEHSDAFFWWIATPVMAATTTILIARPAVRRMIEWRRLSRQRVARRRE